MPPIKGLKREEVYTNKEILEIKDLPESIIIIGAGAIGIEFAGFFSSMGTKVSVFEIMPEILPGTDKEIAEILKNELEKKGVEFYLNFRVAEVKTKNKVEELKLYHKWPVRVPRPFNQRVVQNKPLLTGLRIIDFFFPPVKGGTIAIPGGFGTGKTQLIFQLIKWSDASFLDIFF